MAIKNYNYDYRQLSKVIYRTLLLGGNLTIPPHYNET